MSCLQISVRRSFNLIKDGIHNELKNRIFMFGLFHFDVKDGVILSPHDYRDNYQSWVFASDFIAAVWRCRSADAEACLNPDSPKASVKLACRQTHTHEPAAVNTTDVYLLPLNYFLVHLDSTWRMHVHLRQNGDIHARRAALSVVHSVIT